MPRNRVGALGIAHAREGRWIFANLTVPEKLLVGAHLARDIGQVGNAAKVHPVLVRRGTVPDIASDQTSAQDGLAG